MILYRPKKDKIKSYDCINLYYLEKDIVFWLKMCYNASEIQLKKCFFNKRTKITAKK